MARMFLLQRVVLLLSLSVLAGIVSGAPIDPRNPPDGLFLDEWAEVYMAGGKVGYMHSSMTRRGDAIHTSTLTKMRIGRAAQAVDVETRQTTVEKLDGVPLSFSMEMQASVIKTSIRGTIHEGRVTVVSSQYGMDQTQVFDFPAAALMAWGMFRESLLRGFTPGTQYTLKIYAPEMRLDDALNAVTKVGDWESFKHPAGARRGQRVSVTIEAPAGVMEINSWVDRDGRVLKAKLPAPGLGDMELIATDQAAALADFVPPEVFMTSIVKAGRRMDPGTARRIRYRIRSTNPEVELSTLPTTDMQKLGARSATSVEVVVTRQIHIRPEPRTSARADDLSEYLDANLMINTADPELIQLARRAAGGETDPYKLADKLRRFVSQYITTKNLNIGFATASEVCRNKEGDCSEHGVLLAALARINGLPSRVAVGLAYVAELGGHKDIFGYHLWTQFHIDGRWLDVDAALRETVCSPTRIVFATSSLKTNGLADLSLPLLAKIGAIDIDILEVEDMPAPRE